MITNCYFSKLARVNLLLDQKLKHESLILAQDERWRRA